jgi:hypothetical protein
VALAPDLAQHSATIAQGASMNAIRPLERQDIPQIASLIEFRLGSGSLIHSPGLERFLERTLLDYPWADPEIPSLVYDGTDRIRGFIASQVRRMRYDGEAIRLACVSHLVADPTMHKPVGALLRRMLSGSQDLTLTDTATERVSQMWERLGAERAYVGSVRWLRVFGPLSYVVHAGCSLVRTSRAADIARSQRPPRCSTRPVVGRCPAGFAQGFQAQRPSHSPPRRC